MRLLFTFAGGNGHLEPLIPIAHAAEAAGHVVAFAGRPWMCPTAEDLGFPAFATGSDAGGTPRRMPLVALSAEREDRALRDGFARRNERERAKDILLVCGRWRPDILVCEETDFGGVVTAERLGLPYATVLIIATGSFLRTELIAEPLKELRAENGLPPDPHLSMLSRYLVLSPFAPSYRDPAFPLTGTAHSFRQVSLDPGEDDKPPRWTGRSHGTPTVYFTLGTVFNTESGDLFARVVAGLRDLPVNLIVTVGHHIDPAELGPQPTNVHIKRYIHQSSLLPHCSLVVSHGGSGSVMGALTYGLPMVLIPMGADQPLNAARCEEIGAALSLDALKATPKAVREAVSRVLADPTYREAAQRMRDEISALPGPAHVVTLLERLVAVKRPLFSL